VIALNKNAALMVVYTCVKFEENSFNHVDRLSIEVMAIFVNQIA